MNALIVLGIISFLFYSILIDGTFMKIYLPIVAIYWFLTQTVFSTKDKLWKRRRITASSWSAPSDPTAYLPVEYDVTDLVDYLDNKNRNNPDKPKLTMTYAVTKAFGIGWTEGIPNVGRISFGQFRIFDSIDIAVLADSQGGKDLVPISVKTPHSKSLEEIAAFIKEKASSVRSGTNKTHNKNMKAADFLPTFLFGPMLTIVGYITLNLGWNLSIVGAKGDLYPPIVITNVGSFGLEAGFAPLPPMAAMILGCMGATAEKAWVIDGEIKIRKILKIVYTIDHRVGDAALAMKSLHIIKKLLEDPTLMETLEYEGNELKNRELLESKKDK
jgi:hypothetical protein